MKGYELIKQISDRKIKDNTIIEVRLGNDYKATLRYERFMLKWQAGEFDTSVLCSPEAEFKVIEETKKIEKLDICNFGHNNMIAKQEADIIRKINELVQEVNNLIKEREEKQYE